MERYMGEAVAGRTRSGVRTATPPTEPYSQAELEAMLADTESDLVERKESLRGSAPNKIREAVCAFANDLPDHNRPGVVFVGAADDGTPTGLDLTDELLRQLADIKTDGNIVPPPTMAVTKRRFGEHEVATVTVYPSRSPPVRYRGRTWIRVGPRRAIATRDDERMLNEKRRHHDRPFDGQPMPTASLRDLDLVFFRDAYLPRAIDGALLARNDRSENERLAATKMILSVDDPTPTVTGVLVLATRPQDFVPGAYIQFLRIAGTEWGDPVADDRRCDGTILQQLQSVEDKIAASNQIAVDFRSGMREIRRPVHSASALRQLIHNAVLHRSYEGTNAPVRVYWFDDRVEIISPGGPYGTVTRNNFGEPGRVDYRNPALAEAMRVLGLVQRFGFGIPSARTDLRENGQPEPEFVATDSQILCTVRVAQ